MRLGFRINKKEVLAAGLLCLLGMAAVLQVSANSVARISGWGAGVVPVLLGALLMFVGVLWLFDSRLSPDEDEGTDIGVSKWRGSCGVVSGVFAFLVLAKYAGLLPAIFALVYISVLGDSRYSWRSALLSAACVAGLAALVLAWRPDLPLALLQLS